MAIEKAKKYVPVLDQKYVASSKTSILDSKEEFEYLQKTNAFLVPTRTFDGLVNYNRGTGYTMGDVSLTFEEYKVNYDRGRMLNVDERDNEESAGMAFLGLAGQFIDEKVVPELDKVRLATYASTTGVKVVEDTITTSTQAMTSLRTAVTHMANKKIPVDQRVTFMTETLKGLIDDLDSYKSKALVSSLGTIVTIPDSEFKNEIELNEDEEYVFTSDAQDINFMIISKKSAIQVLTHVAPKIITPEQNQTADSYKFGYRATGICSVYKEKLDGIYVNLVPEEVVEEDTSDLSGSNTQPQG